MDLFKGEYIHPKPQTEKDSQRVAGHVRRYMSSES